MRNRNRTRWLFGALALAGLIVAGASTFTASMSAPAQQVGYTATTVTGGTVSDVKYSLDNQNPPDVTGMTLSVDTSSDTQTAAPVVQFAFNGATMTPCTVGSWSSGQATTTYTCTQGVPAVTADSLTGTAISIATQ